MISNIPVDESLESLLLEHGAGGRAIYLSTLILLLGTGAIAAVTSVDITIRAPATLSAGSERHTLRSRTDGIVAEMHASIGVAVRAGDTLLTLETRSEDGIQAAASAALRYRRSQTTDFETLIATRFEGEAPASLRRLVLPENDARAREMLVEWRQSTMHVARSVQARNRLAILVTRGFAASTELESAEQELAAAQESRALALERRRAGWAQELATSKQHIADLQRDIALRASERTARMVVAPVDGTIEELMPLRAGSVLRAGDAVAAISPSGALAVDALVQPRNVPYLRPGTRARVIVEGFDVQEWGSMEAVITSVGGDYILSDGRPMFRVRMRPVLETLHRSNGTTVQLGKGMRGQVRFLVGRRRLVDLAVNRASEWMDPTAPSVR